MSHTGMFLERISFEVSLETFTVWLDASDRASTLACGGARFYLLIGPKLHSIYVHNASDKKDHQCSAQVSIANELKYNQAADTIFCQMSTLILPQQHHYLLFKAA